MGLNRRDLFGECNVDGAPIDVFTAECCVRCINSECTRSSKGGKFELRVSTWEDRLFRNPPRMDASDPRFSRIAGQNFMAIDTGPIPEIRTSGWIDPLAPARRNEVQAAPTQQAEAEPAPPVTMRLPPRRLVLANAPDQTGKTVGQAPPAPSRDPWAAPSLSDSPGTIISPGATVKFGRGGV